jgi:hypothetical protein
VGPEVWASGPEIDIVLAGSAPNAPEARALGVVDTGASCICADLSILLQLGLTCIDRKQMQVADGTWVEASGFMCRLQIPQLGYRQLVKIFGVKMRYPSTRVLLGRTFLSDYHVTYDGPSQTFRWHRAGPQFYEDHDE